jgi:hypothetical protein
MDCQYSRCFLFVQPLLTFIATFADMPKAGLGSVSGYEEPCLANSFHSIISWHPYLLNPVTFCKLFQGIMALPDCLEFIWKLLVALMTTWLSEII